MDEVQDVVRVWDNGAVSPFNPQAEDIVAWLTDFFFAYWSKKMRRDAITTVKRRRIVDYATRVSIRCRCTPLNIKPV